MRLSDEEKAVEKAGEISRVSTRSDLLLSQGGLSSYPRLAYVSEIRGSRGKSLKLKSRRQNRQYFLDSTLASTAKNILVVI